MRPFRHETVRLYCASLSLFPSRFRAWCSNLPKIPAKRAVGRLTVSTSCLPSITRFRCLKPSTICWILFPVRTHLVEDTLISTRQSDMLELYVWHTGLNFSSLFLCFFHLCICHPSILSSDTYCYHPFAAHIPLYVHVRSRPLSPVLTLVEPGVTICGIHLGAGRDTVCRTPKIYTDVQKPSDVGCFYYINARTILCFLL